MDKTVNSKLVHKIESLKRDGLQFATDNFNHLGISKAPCKSIVIPFKTISELKLAEDELQHLIKDEIIELTDVKTKNKYP